MEPQIRDTLFGDLPLEAWPSSAAQGASLEPWASFAAAREALAAGRMADAIAIWRRVTTMADLESRHYLQAWHFLRAHGENPSPAEAKTLLGVVVEVHLPQGLDLLAAYPDHHARYYNFSGAGIVWEHPDESLDPAVDALLAAAARVLRAVGPWNKPRPDAPPPGHMRLNFLSPAGLHFGQAPMAVLAADSLASPTVKTATALVQQLIARGSAPPR